MTSARFASIAACAIAIAALASPPAFAQQRQGNNKKYIATRDITIDKQTGQLRRPTAEETEALVGQLTAMTNQSTEGLQETSLTNGVRLDLQDRFQSQLHRAGRARALRTARSSARCSPRVK